MFTIYSKKGCANCEKAKMVLHLRGHKFEVKMLDTDYTIEEYMTMFNSRSFPTIVDGRTDTVYKTFEELQEAV